MEHCEYEYGVEHLKQKELQHRLRTKDYFKDLTFAFRE